MRKETRQKKIMEQIRRMEAILQYVLQCLEEKGNVEDKEAAEHFRLNTRYFNQIFRGYFGMPFYRYVAKLRLRRAARAIRGKPELKNAHLLAGYTEKSNFSRAFHTEFGITPKKFAQCDREPDDMPLRETINGRKLTLYYRKVPKLRMAGIPFRPDMGEETDLMENMSFPFDHPDRRIRLDTKEDLIGLWDYIDGKLHYVIGPILKEEDPVPEGYHEARISGGDYAVFALDKGDTPGETAFNARVLGHYVFNEWQPVNHKVTSRMAFTYERFQGSKAFLYLPLSEGWGAMNLKYAQNPAAVRWIDFINKHILENIQINDLAEFFNYTPQHFCDTFYATYHISIQDYIQRRRLYIIARELRKGGLQMQEIAEQFYFPSFTAFDQAFRKEFGTGSENYAQVNANVPDLVEYYSEHRNRVKITTHQIEPFVMIGKPVQPMMRRDEEGVDIFGLTAFFMAHALPGVAGTAYDATNLPEKPPLFALWDERTDAKGNKRIDYLLGPEEIGDAALPTGYRRVSVQGGYYAVFEVEDESGAGDLMETYIMLTRIVNVGWIQENIWRVDLKNRIEFTCYKNEKLYICVPTNG